MKIKFESGEYLNVTATLIESGVPFPNEEKKHAGVHNKFICTVSNPQNGRHMSVIWYGSQNDYLSGKSDIDESMARSILSSIYLDSSCYNCASSFSDFCAEFGYSEDSMRAMRIYNGCKNEAKLWERVSEGLNERTLEEIGNY